MVLTADPPQETTGRCVGPGLDTATEYVPHNDPAKVFHRASEIAETMTRLGIERML